MALLALAAGLLALPSFAFAGLFDFDPPAGIPMNLPLSMRAVAMGAAGTAVVGEGEVDHWANPALVGGVRGVRFESSRTQLIPDLANDVYLDTRFLLVGGGGVGVVLGGAPAGADGVRLDYGREFFGPYAETVRSWGVGIRLVEAWENVQRLRGREPGRLSRVADLAIGWNRKHWESAPQPFYGAGSGTGTDLGLVLRVTPVQESAWPGQRALRVDASLGLAVLNATGARGRYTSGAEGSFTRNQRLGIASSVAWGRLPRTLPPTGARWLLAGFEPLVTATVSADWDRYGYPKGPRYSVNGEGAELRLANVVSLRVGRYDDATGEVHDATYGYAIGLPIGRVAGFQYERSRFPEAFDLSHLDRRMWSAWFDPVAFARAARGE